MPISFGDRRYSVTPHDAVREATGMEYSFFGELFGIVALRPEVAGQWQATE